MLYTQAGNLNQQSKYNKVKLSVGIVLVAIILLLSIFALIFCVKNKDFETITGNQMIKRNITTSSGKTVKGVFIYSARDTISNKSDDYVTIDIHVVDTNDNDLGDAGATITYKQSSSNGGKVSFSGNKVIGVTAGTVNITADAKFPNGTVSSNTITIKVQTSYEINYVKATFFKYDGLALYKSGGSVTDESKQGIYFTDGLGFWDGDNYVTGSSWNQWTGRSLGNGDFPYTGLVKNTLDSNGNIQFNYPAYGIFDENASTGKQVYKNVGVPFMKVKDSQFVLESDKNEIFFQNGSAQSNVNLQWRENKTTYNGSNGPVQGFFPFNSGTTNQDAVYHFGMKVDIPFYMTKDGKNFDGEDITFNFSGDDDIWIFVDGKLVLDSGGIHNKVTSTINFAQNTATVYAGATSTVYNSQKLTDLLGSSWNSNLEQQHKLSVFYLERGKAESNCSISYNMPSEIQVSDVLVHHYIEGTTTRVPSKNGGVVADQTIPGLPGMSYTTSASSDIQGNYVLSKTPSNASGTIGDSRKVVTYYYKLKDPYTEKNQITKTSTLSKITDVSQSVPYTITYSATVKDYVGSADITIVDTLPYKIDTAKSNLNGGTYNDTNKTITWKINATGIVANSSEQMNITKNITVVYKDLNVTVSPVTNKVTGTLELKTPSKTFTTQDTEDIPTEFLKNVTVTKVWSDSNNSEGKRPSSVTLVLKGNGQTYKHQVTSANAVQGNSNNWSYTFTNLPKYNSSGAEIDYQVSEERSSEANNKYYVESYNQQTKTVTNTSKYGKVIVHHYIMNTDGTKTTTKVPSSSGSVVQDELIEGVQGDSYNTKAATNINSNYKLAESPSNASGNITANQIVVTYYYKLKDPTATQTISKTATPTITNLTDQITYNITYNAKLTDYIGSADVTIVDTLPYAIDTTKSDLGGGTYNAQNHSVTWVSTISGIDTYSNKNNNITVTKTLKVVYTGIGQGTSTITNNVSGKITTKTPSKDFSPVTSKADTTTQFKVNIPVTKIWDDSNNSAGKRPTSVTIVLTGNGQTYKQKLTSANAVQGNSNQWTYTFTNLPKYDAQGKEINYQVSEERSSEDNNKYYVESDNQQNKTVTNTSKYGKVIVHHYIMNTDGSKTTNRVPSSSGSDVPDELIEGVQGDSYNTKAATNIDSNYELAQSPSNATGKIAAQDTEVIYYYRLKSTSVLVHHYIDGTSTKVPSKSGGVVADETISGHVNDKYTTKASTNIANNYELVTTKMPSNASGNMTVNQIVVTYYYKYKDPSTTSTISKTATSMIENVNDKITYNINYNVKITDYVGDAEVTIVDTLPYTIDVDNSDFNGGTYNEKDNTVTWLETIKDIDTFANKNSDVTINKTLKIIYTGVSQEITVIKNTVTGQIKTKTPEKEFPPVTGTGETKTQFIINIPVSKVWDDSDNKLGQRPTRVVFKLSGSDGSERTLELAKPGTEGTTTSQDSSDVNKWNDRFTDLPKFDKNNKQIVYTLTEEEKTEGDLKYYTTSISDDNVVTNTNRYGKVVVHYYIMNTDGTTTTTRVPDKTGTEIQDVIIEGKEGEQYTTTDKVDTVNDKYELVTSKLPTNSSGTINKYDENKPQEVIYYYRYKPSKVKIHYIEKDDDDDDSNNQVLATDEKIDGYVDDKYNTNTEHHKDTIEKDGRTYTLVGDSGNTEGTMTVEDTNVTYYYLQNTKATVRYVERDPETHKILKDLEEPTTETGLVGDDFVTNSKFFLGYKLVESPEKTTIKLTKDEQTLIYYYEAVYTGLIENHIDDVTGRILYTEEHQVQVGQAYDVPSKEFDGYDLVETKLPTNARGTMGEDLVTVNYYYIKKTVLEVNYKDVLTGEPLTDQEIDDTKHEGDPYTTEQKTFDNYDLVEVPGNWEGTTEVETDDEGNIINNKTVVTYYYAQKAVVEEHHIDILTGKDLEEPTIHNGHVDDEYSIAPKEFVSYKLVTEDKDGNSVLPTNASGKMTPEKIVVNYYYYQPAKVIVHYIDKTTGKELEENNPETGELQSSQVVIEGQKEDDYHTESKEFKYYKLVESPNNPDGKMTVEITKDEEGNDVVNNTTDVYYYYEPKPFNIGVEKEVSAVIVNGNRRNAENGKVEKVEIYRKRTESTSVQIEYIVKVMNTGEVDGRAIVEDKIPDGMTLANNDGTWEDEGNGKLRIVIPDIKAGETKEYSLLLNWTQSGDNMGNKTNVVSVVETENVPGFKDNNEEDNTSEAKMIISVQTGKAPGNLLIALVALIVLETITLRYAVVLKKKQKKANKK